MPNVLPPGEKSACIAIVAAVNPYEATRLTVLLNTYNDIVPVLVGRQLTEFTTNIDYLSSALAVFTDADLQTAGIYNNKTGSMGLTDPVMICNSTYTGGVVIDTVSSPPADVPVLLIVGKSSVDSVTFDAAVTMKNLIIGPGSTVGYVDTMASGSYIGNIILLFANNTPSILGYSVFGSFFGSVSVAVGSYYGGVQNIPTGSCAIPVTDLAATNVTHNSVALTWTPPSLFSPPESYLALNIGYRKKGSNVWLVADSTTGLLDSDIGYTFTSLDEDTFYEFRIVIVCINGASSIEVTVSAQTICCN